MRCAVKINKLGHEAQMLMRAMLLVDIHGYANTLTVLDRMYTDSMSKAANSNSYEGREFHLEAALEAAEIRVFIKETFMEV